MLLRSIRTAPLIALLITLAAPARAQVPTAMGRQFTLSNAAWKVFIPNGYQQRPGAVADLLVHFHGDPQTYWNNAKYANLNAIIVTVNYSGLSSAYQTPFSNASLFQTVIDQALDKVRQQADIADNLQWDKLAVASFSAGYGAVREILKSSTYRDNIDMLLAADSLYATTTNPGDQTPLDSQMVNYKTFANLAKNGQKTFLFSHSQVLTFTYENTQECGDELLESLGIAATSYNAGGLGDLDFFRQAHSGNFHLWGALGADGDSHLEHLRYIGEFLEELPLAKNTNFAADFNNDTVVDAADLAMWHTEFGNPASDASDFLAWQRQLGSSGDPAAVAVTAPVPEPASIVLLVAAAAARGRRCSRHA